MRRRELARDLVGRLSRLGQSTAPATLRISRKHFDALPAFDVALGFVAARVHLKREHLLVDQPVNFSDNLVAVFNSGFAFLVVGERAARLIRASVT